MAEQCERSQDQRDDENRHRGRMQGYFYLLRLSE